jgi:hypothetical protein
MRRMKTMGSVISISKFKEEQQEQKEIRELLVLEERKQLAETLILEYGMGDRKNHEKKLADIEANIDLYRSLLGSR